MYCYNGFIQYHANIYLGVKYISNKYLLSNTFVDNLLRQFIYGAEVLTIFLTTVLSPI